MDAEERKVKQRGRLRREKLEVVKIIKDPLELLRLSYELVSSARKETQIIFSSARLFSYYYHYQRKSSSLFKLFEMPAGDKGLDVKIITPSDEEKQGHICQTKLRGITSYSNKVYRRNRLSK